MTFEELDEVFAKMMANNKKLKMWTSVFVVAFIAGGVIAMVTMAKPDLGYVLMGLGALCLMIAILIHVDGQKTFKKGQILKETLTKKPEKLVWMYLNQVTKNGVKNEWVVIHTRDGQKLELHSTTLPNKDINAFMYRMRDTYNPNCALGYSAEIERQYMDGKL